MTMTKQTVRTVVIEEAKRSELAFTMLLALEKHVQRLANPGAWDYATKERRHAYVAVLPLLDEAAAAVAREEPWAPGAEEPWPAEIRLRAQQAADVLVGRSVPAFVARRFGYGAQKETSGMLSC